jgi:hypothetical protein
MYCIVVHFYYLYHELLVLKVYQINETIINLYHKNCPHFECLKPDK